MAADAPADYGRLDRAAREMAFGEGLLFRIAQPGLPASFLFGTIHLADPRIAVLSPAVRAAIGQAHTVAVEALDEIGQVKAAQTQRAIAAPDGFRASQLLDRPDYLRLQQLLTRRGFPPTLARQLKAVALALMLDIPNCASARNQRGAFLDAQVLEAAKAGAIPVVGLESLAEQVDIADDLTAAEQTALLGSVLAQSERAEDSVETTIAAYRRGQIGLMLAWTMAPNPIPGVRDAGMPTAVLDRIITARTVRMRDRLMPLLSKGGLFVAVGADHIPGPDGLGVLLQRAGYQIDRLE